MNDRVTIIMPTYKGSKLIYKSILSLTSQTYANIEIIIVDDNGVGTLEQIETEKEITKLANFKNIKYIKHEINKNGSSARNTGVQVSTGEYICFLDDDDIFISKKVEKQVEYLKTNPNIGLVYTGLKEIYPSGETKIILPRDTKDFLFDYLCGRLYVCSSSIMIRKSIIDKVGEWDTSFKRHQDMEYVCRVASLSDVGYIAEALVEKNIENRNLPQDPYLVEKYRLHYIHKMESLMGRYTKDEKREIIFFNYLPIGKSFLKRKKIKKALAYAFKSRKPFKMMFMYVKHGMKFLNKGE